MFESLNKWIFGQDDKNNLVDISGNVRGNNFNLETHKYEKMNRRIQQYLQDDELQVNHDVDNTLKLMRDETQRWEGLNDYRREQNPFTLDELLLDRRRSGRKDEIENDATDDQLLGYCLRLERNNEYLIDLVTRFEEVSFQKRYEELAQANEAMTKEISRLKSINSKVYSSYCDLVDELKAIKKQRIEADKLSGLLIKENEKLKANALKLDKEMQSKTKSETVTKDGRTLILEKESLRKDERITELKMKNQTLERSLNDKDTELTQAKNKSLALSLKLEKLEGLFLNRERDSSTPKSFAYSNSQNKHEENHHKPTENNSLSGGKYKLNNLPASINTTFTTREDNTTELLARFRKNISSPHHSIRRLNQIDVGSEPELPVDDTIVLLKKEWPTKKV